MEAYIGETGEHTSQDEHGDRIMFIAATIETGILFWIIGAFIYFSVRLLCAKGSDGFQVCLYAEECKRVAAAGYRSQFLEIVRIDSFHPQFVSAIPVYRIGGELVTSHDVATPDLTLTTR